MCPCSEIIFPINGVSANKGNVLVAAVHDKTAPIVVKQKKTSIGLSIILDSKFDEALLVRRELESCYDILNNPVIPKLGKHAKLTVCQGNSVSLMSEF